MDKEGQGAACDAGVMDKEGREIPACDAGIMNKKSEGDAPMRLGR